MTRRLPSWVPESLLLALLLAGPLAFGGVEPWARAGLEALAFALALCCFLRGRPSSLSAAADSAWLFPAAMAALGALQGLTPAAPDGPTPALPFTAAPHATDGAVRLWLAYAAVLWSVPRVLLTHDGARRFARALLGLGALVAAAGLLQLAASPRLVYGVREAAGYPFGPYFNRDHAANLLLMGVAAGAGTLAAAWRRRGVSPGGPAAPALGVLAMLASLLAIGSRGAYLAAVAALLALVFFGAASAGRARDRRALAAGALGAGAAALFLAYRYVTANTDAGTRMEASVATRFMLYADSWRLFRQAPLFGSGLGSFETVYPAYQDLGLLKHASQAHSDWVQAALEGGLAALLGALAFTALIVQQGVRAWREARSSEMRGLIAGALAGFLAFAVHSLVEFPFQIPANAFACLALAGFLLSAPSWSGKESPKPRAAPPPFWAAGAAVAAFLTLALSSVRPAAAALRASRYGEPAARADALARAYALDPDPRTLRALGQVYYRAAGEGPGADATLLREALVRELAVCELRPYDSDALYAAGAALLRLGREQDGEALLARALRVRFSPEPRRRAEARP